MAGYIHRQFSCPLAVTHPSSNPAQCRLTALIELNALTTTLHRHLHVCVSCALCMYMYKLHLYMSTGLNGIFTEFDSWPVSSYSEEAVLGTRPQELRLLRIEPKMVSRHPLIMQCSSF